MRIIAGKYRRRTLATTPGTDVTRPTSDRVRESVFNIIAPEIGGAIALDLFSGSGALGIEALSRGASLVGFVERNAQALACIRKNLAELKIPADQAIVVEADVSDFLRRPAAFLAAAFHAKFAASTTLIFADPPYEAAWYDGAIAQVEASGLCATETLAVVEMAHTRELPDAGLTHWEKSGDRKYGKSRVELWRRSSGGQDNGAIEDDGHDT